MKKIKIDDLNKISYTDFVSLICEENRPSGGKFTIREIVKNSFITKDSKVLEIGCTNGFSSLEINKLINCKIIGVDINKNSIENANKRIKENGLDSDRISFEVGNAEHLRFQDNEFDLIICGNAMSFVSNKNKAIEEIKRVLKPNGFISIVPIWYKEVPDERIISKVNDELGFKINCTYEKDWLNYDKWKLELYYKKNYGFIKRTSDDIEKYVNNVIDGKQCLSVYNKAEKNIIKRRWKKTMKIFNENLSLTNFSIILLRKSLEKEEEELFTIEQINY